MFNNNRIMDKYIQRELLKDLKKWIDRKEIYAIKGPRQSGKTTVLWILREWLIKERKVRPENVVFLTFEDREILEKFTLNPKDFIESFISSQKKYYFLLDEFHYVEEGGQKLKLLFDTLKNVKFIITGSSSLEITAFSKYLVGRVFSFYLFPLSFYEFIGAKNERLARIYRKKNEAVVNFLFKNKNFKVERDIFLSDLLKLFNEFVIFGGYPEVVKTKNFDTKKVILKNIYETYIGKDIIELLRISDVIKFRKLVSLLSSQIGNMINYNELSMSCGAYYKELIELINVLEETYVVKTIRPFHRNIRTELRKNPKPYFIDLGLRNYAINNFNLLEERVDKGSMVENFIFNSLMNMTKDFGKISYWRTLGKAEIDFVLNLEREIIPVEVKFAEMKKPKVSRGFRSFVNSYKPKKGLIVTKNLFDEIKINDTMVKFIPACYL